MSKRVSKFATPGEQTTSRGLEAVIEAKNGKLPECYFLSKNSHFYAKIAIFELKMSFLADKIEMVTWFSRKNNNFLFSCRFRTIPKFQKLLPSKFTHDIATTNPTQTTLGPKI